jgi:hypothetical protein
VRIRRLALILFSLSLPLVTRSALSDPDGGRFALRRDDATAGIEVTGLDASQRQSLMKFEKSAAEWAAILSVRMARKLGEPQAAAIVGTYQVVGETVRFIPRYPLMRGRSYVARFDPGRLPVPASSTPIEMNFTLAKPAVGIPTGVVAVYPTAGLLPENQLKFYLHFSAPMARGEAYRRVHLLDSEGREVERPFLELGEELWDAGMTRLTLLFDPGRIKRGLKPREEEGPILQDGKSYTFVIDSAWLDAAGQPLAAAYRKTFRAGPPDETQPDVSRWKIETPPAGAREPLVVRFPEPLDHAMLGHAIEVRLGDAAVSGIVTIGDDQRSWRFVPDRAWADGVVTLQVDPELEDLAGNSLARPFEVDATGPSPLVPSKGPIVIPVPRQARRPR